MRLYLKDRIGHGTFADIFAPPPDDRAYKLFRRITDPVLTQVAPYVFNAETAAYLIAMEQSDLRSRVPAYFGPSPVSHVLAADGTDVSDGYWLELCYAMERLAPDPEERKFGSFFNPSERHLMEPFELAFEGAGIGHLGDASVLYWRTNAPMLIDFAVSDAASDHAHIPPGAV